MYKKQFFFVGEIHRKLPYYTCWSRRNEEPNLKTLAIAKSTLTQKFPESFSMNLEFFGYDLPIMCSTQTDYSENPVFNQIWTYKGSGFVL